MKYPGKPEGMSDRAYEHLHDLYVKYVARINSQKQMEMKKGA